MLRYALLFGLVLSVVTSAVSVIYVKHESRKHFVELQKLERERDVLQTDWNRWQLEYSAWATHDRIADVARRKLEFYAPTTDAVVLVQVR